MGFHDVAQVRPSLERLAQENIQDANRFYKITLHLGGCFLSARLNLNLPGCPGAEIAFY